MHISIQVCSIIIVLFLAIIFSRQKKLGIRSERIFLEILIITLISLVLDISSVAAIYYKESCPGLLVLVVSKTYLVSLIILAFVIGCIAGSVVHLFRMKVCGAGRMLALGPYLSVGIFIAALWGNGMIDWYLGLFM